MDPVSEQRIASVRVMVKEVLVVRPQKPCLSGLLEQAEQIRRQALSSFR